MGSQRKGKDSSFIKPKAGLDVELSSVFYE